MTCPLPAGRRRLVGGDLHFVAQQVDDGLLEEDRRIAEGRFRFARCGFDRFLEL